jgi:hypothetical protein
MVLPGSIAAVRATPINKGKSIRLAHINVDAHRQTVAHSSSPTVDSEFAVGYARVVCKFTNNVLLTAESQNARPGEVVQVLCSRRASVTTRSAQNNNVVYTNDSDTLAAVAVRIMGDDDDDPPPPVRSRCVVL